MSSVHGSGSAKSVYFLGFLDPDTLVRGADPDSDLAPDQDPSIIKQK